MTNEIKLCECHLIQVSRESEKNLPFFQITKNPTKYLNLTFRRGTVIPENETFEIKTSNVQDAVSVEFGRHYEIILREIGS